MISNHDVTCLSFRSEAVLPEESEVVMEVWNCQEEDQGVQG